MTAQETIEYAQVSVDTAQRGLDFVQDKIDRVDDLMLVVDDISATASTVVAGTRRWSRRGLIIGGVLVIGVIVIVIASRRCRGGEPVAPTDDPSESSP
jgi:C-terminal processing protease CtpA/Prc